MQNNTFDLFFYKQDIKAAQKWVAFFLNKFSIFVKQLINSFTCPAIKLF
jgi:hypothetical protein